MKCNIGKTDRTLRIIVGVALLASGLIGHNWLLAVLGCVPLLTGIMRWCPVYVPMGISTVKPEK